MNGNDRIHIARPAAVATVCVGLWLASHNGAAQEGHPLPPKQRGDLRHSLADQERTLTEAIAAQPRNVELYSQRGDVRLFLGQFEAALEDYDHMVALQPDVDASHWRRGIALFYAGRYAAAARQFERYHVFDNIDRENGIWRFLSQQKADGTDAAQTGLLKYEKDDREPFPDVYRLFAGTLTPEDVLSRIESAELTSTERAKRLFYAQLYIGLLHAVHDRNSAAMSHLRRAVASDWPETAGYGPRYMWHVGRLHYEQLVAASAQQPAQPANGAAPPAEPEAISLPPPSLHLDPFYQKCLLVEGFPIVASAKVHDAAVREAAWVVTRMLEHRPDLLQALKRQRDPAGGDGLRRTDHRHPRTQRPHPPRLLGPPRPGAGGHESPSRCQLRRGESAAVPWRPLLDREHPRPRIRPCHS